MCNDGCTYILRLSLAAPGIISGPAICAERIMSCRVLSTERTPTNGPWIFLASSQSIRYRLPNDKIRGYSPEQLEELQVWISGLFLSIGGRFRGLELL